MAVARLPSGIEIFHRLIGRGEPLLLVAGTAADHTLWGAQIPAYRKRHLTVTYDARGTGRSSKPEDVPGYTMAALADDAAALLDTLQIASAHVSGLSLGSAVAQEMALRHPEMVRTLQLHGTWARTDAWLAGEIDRLEALARETGWPTLGRTMLREGLSPAYLEAHLDRAERLARGLAENNPHPPSRTGILGHLHADRGHDTLERLGSVGCPTLVTTGEIDGQIPPRYGRAVAERIPGATLHEFRGPNASHLACLEMQEEFNRVTLGWLAAQG